MGGCGSKNEVDHGDPTQPKKRKKKDQQYDIQVVTQSDNIWDPQQRGGINCMAISEDQSMVATGSEDAMIRIWSSKTERCECLATLQGHNDYLNAILFEEQVDENNIYIISCSADKTIKKWNIATLECVFTLTGHNSIVNRIICTGDYIFSSSYDKSCKCWDFDSGELVRSFTGHKRGVYPMIFIPEFTPDQEDEDAASSNRNFGAEGSADVLITGSADFTARAWSFETGKTINVFTGHTGSLTSMTVDERGKQLFTGATDHKIIQWNIIRGTKIRTFEGHTGSIISMMIKNKILYSGSSDHTARSWIIEFGDCSRIYKGFKHTVICIKFYNGILFTGCGDGVVRAFDAKSGALKREYIGHCRSVNCIQVIPQDVELDPDDPDEEVPNVTTDLGEHRVVHVKLFSGSVDGTLRVWDASGLKDETIFSKDDEEKKKAEKEKAKKRKQKAKEREKLMKQNAKLGGNRANAQPTGRIRIEQDAMAPYSHGNNSSMVGNGSAAGGHLQYGGYMQTQQNGNVSDRPESGYGSVTKQRAPPTQRPSQMPTNRISINDDLAAEYFG